MKKNIIFVLLLVFVLSACTDKTSIGAENNLKSNQINIKENLIETDGTIYNGTSIILANEEIFVWLAAKTENTIYFYAIDESRTNLFYEYDIANNESKLLDINVEGNIQSIDAFDNCLYVLVNRNANEESNGYEFKVYNTVTQDMKSIIIDEVITATDSFGIIDFTVVDSKIYVNAFNSIYCFNDNGKMNAEVKVENIWREILYSVNDDCLMLYNYINNSFVVQKIDFNLEPTFTYTISRKYNEAFAGILDNQIFVTDENSVYSLNLDTGDKKQYVSILLHNLDISSFIPLSNESFFTIQNGIPTIWTASAQKEEEQTAVLKCATYNASYELQVAVSLFNYNHDDIKIDVVDYSQYDEGMTKLIAEITAGNIPDIFDLSSIPITTLSSSGYLQNLEGYLSGKNIVPNILETLRKDEGIFELVPGFRVAAMAGSSAYINSDTLDVDNLLELAEKASLDEKYVFPKYITKEKFISFILSYSGDSFVDIEKGYCNFEDERFASLIQVASQLPSDNDMSDDMYTEAVINEQISILDGKQLVSIVETGNPVSELLKLRTLYSDSVKFVGFPTNSGNGISMTPFVRLAMSSTSLYKDDIWAFFDYLLSEEFQIEMSTTRYMPVIRDSLSDYINTIIEEYIDSPLKFAISNSSDFLVLDGALVDDETENDIWDLISRVDCINEYDTNIYIIVIDACQPFFAGKKDISEVISIIQNRASIYVYERQ